MKAELTDEELAAFQAAIAPLSQVDAMRALMLWFTRQDEVIRMDILDLLPKRLKADIARLALEEMAKRPRGKR